MKISKEFQNGFLIFFGYCHLFFVHELSWPVGCFLLAFIQHAFCIVWRESNHYDEHSRWGSIFG